MILYRTINKALLKIIPKSGRHSSVHSENTGRLSGGNKFWVRQRIKLYTITRILLSKKFMAFFLDYDSVRETYTFEQMSWYLTTVRQSEALRGIAHTFASEVLGSEARMKKQDSLISEANKILEKVK